MVTFEMPDSSWENKLPPFERCCDECSRNNPLARGVSVRDLLGGDGMEDVSIGYVIENAIEPIRDMLKSVVTLELDD